MSLLDKVAIVTGSSKGIEFEIAKKFSERGAIVIVCSRNLGQSKVAAKKLKGPTLAVEVDITDESSIKKFIKAITKRYQKIDILVNNSGYPLDATIWNKQIHEGSDGELEKIIDVDLFGSVRLCRAVLPIMMQNLSHISPSSNVIGGREGGVGVIINISSTPAISGVFLIGCNAPRQP